MIGSLGRRGLWLGLRRGGIDRVGESWWRVREMAGEGGWEGKVGC